MIPDGVGVRLACDFCAFSLEVEIIFRYAIPGTCLCECFFSSRNGSQRALAVLLLRVLLLFFPPQIREKGEIDTPGSY